MSPSPSSLSERVDRLLARYRPLADRTGFAFRRPRVSSAARPTVLFLGNHSSGKSSFVNFLLDDAEQATGVAPTDDGFTVLLCGAEDSDAAGPAALDRLPAEYAVLRELGDAFLQHLRVKFRRRAILRGVTLVDSPGMIGGAGGETRRGYDFFSAVRRVSEIADLVLFLFDPEKPGTTGETVHALGSCFRGMEYKLRLLMNKCDSFEGMYDFARAYGALCWNLAHVLPVKDLPQVFTTFIPGRRKEAARIALEDFDRQREEIVSQVSHAEERKADNLLAAAGSDLAELSMLARVV
ncbi:MAG: 50S ribosome-binding GTPase, partial [Kiritimatiellae bacterium]|nr:50S ribosome-binding GTPase [Kiritimatiellia bacterium]